MHSFFFFYNLCEYTATVAFDLFLLNLNNTCVCFVLPFFGKTFPFVLSLVPLVIGQHIHRKMCNVHELGLRTIQYTLHSLSSSELFDIYNIFDCVVRTGVSALHRDLCTGLCIRLFDFVLS